MHTDRPDAPSEAPVRWQRLCDAAELEPRRALRITVEGLDLLVARVDGTAHAVDNRCTHADACLHEGRVRGARVICPLHGGAFDLRTGAAVGLPATAPLHSYTLREVAGVIEVCLPSI